jgi:hypothetical protein
MTGRGQADDRDMSPISHARLWGFPPSCLGRAAKQLSASFVIRDEPPVVDHRVEEDAVLSMRHAEGLRARSTGEYFCEERGTDSTGRYRCELEHHVMRTDASPTLVWRTVESTSRSPPLQGM